MKKKLIFLILGIVLLLGIIGGFLYFTRDNVAQTVTYGSTFMSIDNAYIIDSGQRIVVEGRINSNGAENLKVDFNKDDINGFLEGSGYEVSDIATLEVAMTDPSREFYAVKELDKPFVAIGSYELSLLKSCANNKPAGLENVDVFRVGNTKLCVYEVGKGVYSHFTNSIVDNTEVVFKLDGTKIGSIKPSTDSNVVSSSDKRTKIEWTGNLLNYQTQGSPNYALLFSNSKYEKLIDDGAWNSYENLMVDYKMNNGIGFFTSTANAFESISAFNSALNTILADKTSNFKNEVNAIDTKFTSNGLEAYLSVASAFPTFKITLDADYVAIEELSGKPEIISCISDKKISSGDKYNTQLLVKNIGANTGAFSGTITCAGDSNVVDYAIPGQQVLKGKTVSFSTQITGINSVSGTQSNTCTAIIRDTKSGNSDSCTFDLDVDYVENIICEPGKKTCANSDSLKTCNAKGTAFTLTPCSCIVLESGEAICKVTCSIDSDCKSNQNCVDGVCVDKEVLCKPWLSLFGKTIIPNFVCLIKNWFLKFQLTFAIVLGILGGLVGGLFAVRFTEKQQFKKKWWIIAIVVVVLGGTIGYLAYVYFWTAILILIGLGIIKAFVPGI